MRISFKPTSGAILNSLFWLAVGLSGGWWIHSLTNPPLTAPASVVREVVVEKGVPIVRGSSVPDFGVSLDEYIQAQKSKSGEADLHREWILNQAERMVKEKDRRGSDLIDRFLTISANDPRAMLIKSRALLGEERFDEAIETILELKRSPQTEVPPTQIKRLLDEIAGTYAANLKETERYDDLIDLFDLLAQAVPEDVGYYYKLADAFYHASRYDDAAEALDFSLYDSKWGVPSQKLLQKIQQYLALADGEQVPLASDGGHFYVIARVDHIPGVHLLIDTGASVSALKPEIARQLGVDFSDDDTVVVQGANSEFNAPRAVLESLAIGEAEVEDLEINIVELGDGIDADGLLGMNFLGRFRFFIDQERELLFLGAR